MDEGEPVSARPGERGGGVIPAPAANSWGRGHALSLEEAESWFNVCEERLRRASVGATGEPHWDMVGQGWVDYMGRMKWEGAEQPPDMQWDTCLWDVCGWLRESDCLWLQQRPENEIVARPPGGALRLVAGNLGLELDVSDCESDAGPEGGGGSVGRMVLDGDLTGWSHGRGGKRVFKRADFGAARALCGGMAGLRRGDLGGVGTVGTVPAPGIGGVVRVVPALPLTPVRASPDGGEGRGAGRVVEDIDMGGTGHGGVAPAPAPVGVDGGCGCNCGVALAGVRREMVREVKRVRDELMGAVSLLLAEKGLRTWEEERRLESVRSQLIKDRERAKKAHEVDSVAERVKADEAKLVARAQGAEKRAEEAALRQEKERAARLEREREVRRNAEVAALTMKGAMSDEERLAAAKVVVQADDELKKLEGAVPAAPEVVTEGAWQGVGGVVTRRVEVVVRLHGPVGRDRTAGLKGVVEKVQFLVKESGRVSWNVGALVWTEHAADEILWRITGVGRDTSDEVVRKEVADDVTAVVRAGLVRDSWVEGRRSRYVVVGGIPEAEWLKDGMSKLKGGTGEVVWGRRAPVVTLRTGKAGAARVSVKMEVVSGEAAASLVKGGAIFLGVRKEVVLAVRGGGASVPRQASGASPAVRGCYTCGDRGHVQRFCPKGVPMPPGGGLIGRCWGCGEFGHRALNCPGRSLAVMGPNGPSPGHAVWGSGIKRGGGTVAGAPMGRGGALKGGSDLGYVGASRAPVGGAPQGAR